MSTALATAVLGRTKLKVTRLGLNTADLHGPRIWGGRNVTEAQAQKVLNAALDAGINFIDTANDYGRSEEFIGKFIAHRRSEYILATKCGCRVTPRDSSTDDTPHVWTSENLYRCLHESLQRMKTEYVDILQLHNPTVEECQRGGLVDVLQNMRLQGKVLWTSVATTLPHLPTFLQWGVFDTIQIPYSALQRDHENWISKAAASGAGIIIRSSLMRGEPGVMRGPADPWAKFEEARLDELLEIGERGTAFMLRFILTHPQAHTIAMSMLEPQHLRENIDALKQGPLPQGIYQEVKHRLTRVGLSPAA